MNEDINLYVRQNVEDAPVYELHIDEHTNDTSNGSLDVMPSTHEVSFNMLNANEIIALMKDVWLEDLAKKTDEDVIRRLTSSNSPVEKRNRAHRDYRKFVRSL